MFPTPNLLGFSSSPVFAFTPFQFHARYIVPRKNVVFRAFSVLQNGVYSMPVRYIVTLKRSVLKSLEHLPESVQERLAILEEILRTAALPVPANGKITAF
jgi:hypothetical protein